MIEEHMTQLTPYLWSGDRVVVDEGIDVLRRLRIGHVISLVDVEPLVDKLDICHTMFPIDDYEVVNPKDINDALTPEAFLLERPGTWSDGERVGRVKTYIHCRKGQNRSTMMACAWLVLHEGMDPEQAAKFVERRRTEDLQAIGEYPSIMTDEMRESLFTFAQWVNA